MAKNLLVVPKIKKTMVGEALGDLRSFMELLS
jgi:hypothetical protein